MDEETKRHVLETNEYSDDNLQAALDIRNEAMEKADEDLIVKATLQVFMNYESMEAYEDAVHIVNQVLKDDIVKTHNHMLKLIDKKISLLLKIEDYTAMEKTLKDRKKLVETDEKAYIMQKFYQAVTYEGLKQYNASMRVLKDIPDTLSNTQLTSKYLKMGMLALKTDDETTFEEAIRKVQLFDPKEKNPMIHLLRADVALKNKHYDKAKSHYETFFLRSGLKNRYLDRYLRILTHEGDFDEALRFFNEKEPSVAKMTSIKYKKEFYLAGRELSMRLNNERLRTYCERRIAAYDRTLGEENVFKTDIQPVINATRDVSRFESERELLRIAAHTFCMLIDPVRFAYIRSESDNLIVLQHNKGLLLEQDMDDSDDQAQLYRAIIKTKKKEIVWTSPENTLGVAPIVFAADLSTDGDDRFYCVVVDDNKNGFTQTIDACRMFAGIMQDKRAHYRRYHRQYRQNEILLKFLNEDDIAMLKVIPRGLMVLNKAPSLPFGDQKAVLSVDSFMDWFIKPTYFDALFKDSPHVLRTKDKKTIKLNAVKKDEDAFLFIEDITETTLEKKEERSLTHNNWFLNAPGLGAFQNDFINMKPNFSVVEVSFHIHSKIGLLSDGKQNVKDAINDMFDAVARRHLRGIYANSVNDWIVLLRTTDKRVLKRIKRDIKNHLIDTLGVSVVRIDDAIIRSNQARSDFKNKLPRWQTRMYDSFAPDPEHLALAETVLTNIDEMIETNDVPVEQTSAGSWRGKTVNAWLFQIREDALLAPLQIYDDLIVGQLRKKAFDHAFIQSVISILEKTRDVIPAYLFIPIYQSVSSDAFINADLNRLFRKKVFKETTIVFVLDGRFHDKTDLQAISDSDTDMLWAGQHLIDSYAPPKQKAWFNALDFVLVDENEIDYLFPGDSDDTVYIFSHGKQTLKKSILETHHIAWVSGRFWLKGEDDSDARQK